MRPNEDRTLKDDETVIDEDTSVAGDDGGSAGADGRAGDRSARRTGGAADGASDMLPADAERMLAATLALMTSFYRCPHTAVCRKLLDNLALLSRHPQLSGPMRKVCRNAEARWASYLEEVEQAITEIDESECDDVDDDVPPLTLH